jgi:uncharacterized repeat protein (TIGR03803 family)
MSRLETGAQFLAPRVTTVLFIVIAILFLACALPLAESQTYSVIYNFTGKAGNGASPYSGPIVDQSGNLYGTTYTGGRFGAGSVYRLAPGGSGWTYSSLYSFKAGSDGVGPAFGSLALGADGTLYGTTEGGGVFGTAFAVCSCGVKEVVLHRFGSGTDGGQPIGGVVLGPDGSLYGTTSEVGAFGNGTVYEIKHSGDHWSESTLYSFNSNGDPNSPAAGVTLDPEGNLYGTASLGGAYGNGAVYKLTRSGAGWTESVLYNFQGEDDGANPVGGVVLDRAGNLYGTTFDGGVNGGGTVYEMSPSANGWSFTTIYSFVGGYGGPYNKLTLANGSVYGFTNTDGANGFGSIFKLTLLNGVWIYTDLYDFTGGSDGADPYGSVAVDSKGNIFGTTNIGGSTNQGVVFEITP